MGEPRPMESYRWFRRNKARKEKQLVRGWQKFYYQGHRANYRRATILSRHVSRYHPHARSMPERVTKFKEERFKQMQRAALGLAAFARSLLPKRFTP